MIAQWNRIPILARAAALLVIVVNTFVLVQAARNRSGEPESEIELTQRELYSWHTTDDSAVTLRLNWLNPTAGYRGPSAPDAADDWLGQSKLEELGFDCHIPASSAKAPAFYRRSEPRAVWVALEYDGPAWQAYFENRTGLDAAAVERERSSASRLVAIDAAPGRAVLRARHPDRRRVILLPGSVRLFHYPAIADRPARLGGYIENLPREFHVPMPFSEGFRQSASRSYRVLLRFGASGEPWVAGVDFTAATK